MLSSSSPVSFAAMTSRITRRAAAVVATALAVSLLGAANAQAQTKPVVKEGADPASAPSPTTPTGPNGEALGSHNSAMVTTPAELVTTSAQFIRRNGKRIAIEGVLTREKLGDTIAFDGTRVIPLDPAGGPHKVPSGWVGKRVRVTGFAEVWENAQTEEQYNAALARDRKAGSVRAHAGYMKFRLMLKSARMQQL
ncbi:hypothetical protein DB346_06445 [Verrucomicrobia bacterium LW23]|nr:hypothetical protein DB346_06445 [Verrucomicrobia bacterium LW23]